MTIDEAISHEERNVEINKLIGEVSDCEPTNAIDYHRQLVEWLKELKQLRKQEPKTGQWITTRTFMHDGEYYCDRCKFDSPYNEKWDYCPNCGAKMEVEK